MEYNMQISPVDDCVWLNEEATLMIDGDTPEEAMGAAMILNSHSQLAEENAKLREFVEMISSAKVYTVEVSNPYGGTDDMDCLCDSLKDKAKQLLNQLKEQQNEQAN